MIFSSGTKQPKIHSSAYVAPTRNGQRGRDDRRGVRGAARRRHHGRGCAGDDRRSERHHGERGAQSQRRKRLAVSALDRRPVHRWSPRLRRRGHDRQRLLRGRRREDFQRRDARRRQRCCAWRDRSRKSSRKRGIERTDAARRGRRSGNHLRAGASTRAPREDRTSMPTFSIWRRAKTSADAPPRRMQSFCGRRTPRTQLSRSTATSSRRRRPRLRSG